ncbi:hypothetical protein MRX96_010041 [Rhipicephalus microplus]
MTSSVLDVDHEWDRADRAGMDPDDVLMSQIDLGNLEPQAEIHDCVDEDVDEDLLREQLEFQAQAAGDSVLQDTVGTDGHDTSEPYGKVAECQEKMRSLNGLLTISFSGSDTKLPVLLNYDEWKQD